MEMKAVKSSNIKKIGHEKETLYVAFKGGGLYKYDKVPEVMFKAFLNSESKGKYFHQKIRNNYKYKRIGEIKDERIKEKNDKSNSTS